MKNPMDRQLEKRLSKRAVEIGREGEIDAFDELLTLLRYSSARGQTACFGISKRFTCIE